MEFLVKPDSNDNIDFQADFREDTQFVQYGIFLSFQANLKENS